MTSAKRHARDRSNHQGAPTRRARVVERGRARTPGAARMDEIIVRVISCVVAGFLLYCVGGLILRALHLPGG